VGLIRNLGVRQYTTHEWFWNHDTWILHPFLWFNYVYWTLMSNFEHPMGVSIIYWTTSNSFIPFKKERTWNWKLRWHATIAQNLWFDHIIFNFYDIFLKLKYIYIYIWILQLIFIFIQKLLGKKLQILNFIIYLYINSIDDSKPSKI